MITNKELEIIKVGINSSLAIIEKGEESDFLSLKKNEFKIYVEKYHDEDDEFICNVYKDKKQLTQICTHDINELIEKINKITT